MAYPCTLRVSVFIIRFLDKLCFIKLNIQFLYFFSKEFFSPSIKHFWPKFSTLCKRIKLSYKPSFNTCIP